MRDERLNPLKFIHNSYNTKYLRQNYSYTSMLINRDDMWAEALDEPLTFHIFHQRKKEF